MSVISHRPENEFKRGNKVSSANKNRRIPDKGDPVLKEYSSDHAVLRYTRSTAGTGIEFLLEHDYGDIYKDVICRYIPAAAKESGLNVLEFGCGGGMNLIYLVSLLERMGIKVGRAYGTDFSDTLIAAANQEADTYLSANLRTKVTFCLARNESLIEDMVSQLDIKKEELQDLFHLVLGVNTIRYCHRLEREKECAHEIYSLLAEGCTCIIIDMNRKFPFFRSRFRDRIRKSADEIYLPALDDYASPFIDAGFQVIRKSYFSWIPHSAKPLLLRIIRRLTPVLNILVPTHAMRCLVVARKPPRMSSNGL